MTEDIQKRLNSLDQNKNSKKASERLVEIVYWYGHFLPEIEKAKETRLYVASAMGIKSHVTINSQFKLIYKALRINYIDEIVGEIWETLNENLKGFDVVQYPLSDIEAERFYFYGRVEKGPDFRQLDWPISEFTVPEPDIEATLAELEQRENALDTKETELDKKDEEFIEQQEIIAEEKEDLEKTRLRLQALEETLKGREKAVLQLEDKEKELDNRENKTIAAELLLVEIQNSLTEEREDLEKEKLRIAALEEEFNIRENAVLRIEEEQQKKEDPPSDPITELFTRQSTELPDQQTRQAQQQIRQPVVPPPPDRGRNWIPFIVAVLFFIAVGVVIWFISNPQDEPEPNLTNNQSEIINTPTLPTRTPYPTATPTQPIIPHVSEAPGPTLASTDFSEWPGSEWELNGDNFTIGSGKLKASGPFYLATGSPDWTDYAVEIDISKLYGASTGHSAAKGLEVHLRKRDDSNYINLIIGNIVTCHFEWFIYTDGVRRKIYDSHQPTDDISCLGVWRIEALGDNFNLYLNSEPQYSLIQPNYEQGSFGLEIDEGNVNTVIEGIRIEELN